jgi:hypothetical protein
MRMSALRQLPPQGSYVNSDGVLLAQMSLLGRFYEVPSIFSSAGDTSAFRVPSGGIPAKSQAPHISGVSSFARIFSVHLPRASWRWTEVSLLFYVVSLDQDTLSGHVEGFNHAANQVLYNVQVAKQPQPISSKRRARDPLKSF